jgi:putative salt-induced outer membrane protein
MKNFASHRRGGSSVRVGIAAGAVALVAAASAASADAPAFVNGKPEDVKDVKDVDWTAKGEAGLVESTGNSETTTVTVGLNATRKDKDNKLDMSLAGTFARATIHTATDANANGVIDPGELSSSTATSAENAIAKVRFDRYLTPLDALYVTGTAATDRPAGKDFVGGGQGGYSRGLYKTDAQEVLAELGYDLSYLRLADDTSTTIHSLRAFVGYKGKLNTQASLDVSLEALFNANSVTIGVREASAFEDTRLNGNIGITASLSSKLSLNAAFTAKFDNVPAPLAKVGDLPFAMGYVPVAEKLDTTTKVSLIVKFL